MAKKSPELVRLIRMEPWVESAELIKKVVAADKSGAKIFFAPNDPITEEMKKRSKYRK